MITRRAVVAALALAPLAACASAPATTPTSQGASAAAQSPSMAATGEVVVYVPGAFAATVKALQEAYATSGAGTVSFEVGHTPVQREQLAQGATPDVWIAANPADMTAAAEAGHVDQAGVRQLARTRLVVVVAPNNPAGITGLGDLAKPGVKLLVGADAIPIGTATAKTLGKLEASQGAGFQAKVEANIVSREMGVQPIVNKVTMGEADAGIVFVTDLPADLKGATQVEIPDADNTLVAFSIAPVTLGKNKAGADAFIVFMTAGAGQALLTETGYLPPAP